MSPSALFPILYVMPFLVFAAAGAPLAMRRGWRGIAALFGGCVGGGSAALTLLGAIHRSASGFPTAGIIPVGLLLCLVGLTILLLPSVVTLGVLHDRGAGARWVYLVSVGLTLFIGVAGYLPFALTIGCALTAECL